MRPATDPTAARLLRLLEQIHQRQVSTDETARKLLGAVEKIAWSLERLVERRDEAVMSTRVARVVDIEEALRRQLERLAAMLKETDRDADRAQAKAAADRILGPRRPAA